MKALGVVLAAIAWVGAMVATVGAAMLNPTVMGVAGLAAAVAALLWGLVSAVRKPRRVPPPWVIEHGHPYREVQTVVTHRPGVARTVIRGGQQPADEAHRPFWDTGVMGAPE